MFPGIETILKFNPKYINRIPKRFITEKIVIYALKNGYEVTEKTPLHLLEYKEIAKEYFKQGLVINEKIIPYLFAHKEVRKYIINNINLSEYEPKTRDLLIDYLKEYLDEINNDSEIFSQSEKLLFAKAEKTQDDLLLRLNFSIIKDYDRFYEIVKKQNIIGLTYIDKNCFLHIFQKDKSILSHRLSKKLFEDDEILTNIFEEHKKGNISKDVLFSIDELYNDKSIKTILELDVDNFLYIVKNKAYKDYKLNTESYRTIINVLLSKLPKTKEHIELFLKTCPSSYAITDEEVIDILIENQIFVVNTTSFVLKNNSRYFIASIINNPSLLNEGEIILSLTTEQKTELAKSIREKKAKITRYHPFYNREIVLSIIENNLSAIDYLYENESITVQSFFNSPDIDNLLKKNNYKISFSTPPCVFSCIDFIMDYINNNPSVVDNPNFIIDENHLKEISRILIRKGYRLHNYSNDTLYKDDDLVIISLEEGTITLNDLISKRKIISNYLYQHLVQKYDKKTLEEFYFSTDTQDIRNTVLLNMLKEDFSKITEIGEAFYGDKREFYKQISELFYSDIENNKKFFLKSKWLNTNSIIICQLIIKNPDADLKRYYRFLDDEEIKILVKLYKENKLKINNDLANVLFNKDIDELTTYYSSSQKKLDILNIISTEQDIKDRRILHIILEGIKEFKKNNINAFFYRKDYLIKELYYYATEIRDYEAIKKIVFILPKELLASCKKEIIESLKEGNWDRAKGRELLPLLSIEEIEEIIKGKPNIKFLIQIIQQDLLKNINNKELFISKCFSLIDSNDLLLLDKDGLDLILTLDCKKDDETYKNRLKKYTLKYIELSKNSPYVSKETIGKLLINIDLNIDKELYKKNLLETEHYMYYIFLDDSLLEDKEIYERVLEKEKVNKKITKYFENGIEIEKILKIVISNTNSNIYRLILETNQEYDIMYNLPVKNLLEILTSKKVPKEKMPTYIYIDDINVIDSIVDYLIKDIKLIPLIEIYDDYQNEKILKLYEDNKDKFNLYYTSLFFRNTLIRDKYMNIEEMVYNNYTIGIFKNLSKKEQRKVLINTLKYDVLALSLLLQEGPLDEEIYQELERINFCFNEEFCKDDKRLFEISFKNNPIQTLNIFCNHNNHSISYDELIEYCLSIDDYILTKNSPNIFKNNIKICIKSLKKDPTSIYYFDSNIEIQEETEEIIDTLIKSEIEYDNRLPKFVLRNQKFILHSIKKNIKLLKRVICDYLKSSDRIEIIKLFKKQLKAGIIEIEDNYPIWIYYDEEILDITCKKYPLFLEKHPELMQFVKGKQDEQAIQKIIQELLKNPLIIDTIDIPEYFIISEKDKNILVNKLIKAKYVVTKNTKDFVFNNELILYAINNNMDIKDEIIENYLILDNFKKINDKKIIKELFEKGYGKRYSYIVDIIGLDKFIELGINYGEIIISANIEDLKNITNPYELLAVLKIAYLELKPEIILNILDKIGAIITPEELENGIKIGKQTFTINDNDEIFYKILVENPNYIIYYKGINENVFKYAIEHGYVVKAEDMSFEKIRKSQEICLYALEHQLLDVIKIYTGNDTELQKRIVETIYKSIYKKDIDDKTATELSLILVMPDHLKNDKSQSDIINSFMYLINPDFKHFFDEIGIEQQLIIKYSLTNKKTKDLIFVLNNKQEPFLKFYNVIKEYIEYDQEAYGIDIFYKTINLYCLKPELCHEITEKGLTKQEAIYLIEMLNKKDIPTEESLSDIDKKEESMIDRIKSVLENSVSAEEIKNTILKLIFNMDIREFNDILENYINYDTLAKIRKKAEKNPTKNEEILSQIIILETIFKMMEDTINSTNDPEELKKLLQSFMDNKDLLDELRIEFYNIKELIRNIYELDANLTLTDLSSIPKSKIRKSADGKYDIIELSSSEYAIYAHCAEETNGYRIEDFVKPRLNGRVTICVSPISNLGKKLYSDSGVIIGYTHIPRGSFIISSNTNMGSNTYIKTNNYEIEELESEGFYQLEFKDSSSLIPKDHPETILYREGLLPSCIILREDEPTEAEIDAKNRLSAALGYDIPFVHTQKIGHVAELSEEEKEQIQIISSSPVEKETKLKERKKQIERIKETLEQLKELEIEVARKKIKKREVHDLIKKKIGGSHEMYQCHIEGKDGIFYLKPGCTKGGYSIDPHRSYAMKAAYHIQSIVNPEGAVYVDTVLIPGREIGIKEEEVLCSIIRVVENSTTIEKPDFENKPLTSRDITSLLLEFITDYLLFSYDTKSENFLRTKDRKIYGIDKEQALKYVLSSHFVINNGTEKTYDTSFETSNSVSFDAPDIIYHPLFKAIREGKQPVTEETIRICLDAISRIDSLTDEQYLLIFKNYIDSYLENENATKEHLKTYIEEGFSLKEAKELLRKDLENSLLARKHDLRKQFVKYLKASIPVKSDVLEEEVSQWDQGSATSKKS